MAERVSVLQMLRAVVHSYYPKRSKDLIIVRMIYRPLSFPLTLPPLLLGMSPNQVTFINLVMVVAASVLLISPHTSVAFAGVALFILVFIGDCVDGNMARFLDRRRYFGKLIDGLVDVTVFALYIAVAIGNIRRGGNWFSPMIEMGAGVAILVAILFSSYFRARLSLVLAEVRSPQSRSVDKTVRSPNLRRRMIGALQSVYENLGPAGPLLLILAMSMDRVSLLLMAYGVIYPGFALAEVVYGLLVFHRPLDVPRPADPIV